MFSRIKAFFYSVDKEKKILSIYSKRYFFYSFRNGSCKTEKQYEASITRFYHTIEKGLSYLDYRPGFGRDVIEVLISEMEKYSKKFDIEKFFYKTALSTLYAYVEKNREHGFADETIEKKLNSLPGERNHCGGCFSYTPLEDFSSVNFEMMVKNRHSIRHFSKEPLDIGLIEKALSLAQYTPSACNRQGWRTYIIRNTNIKSILENQNGNNGFGHEFDKLLLITGDLQYFNRDREVFQVFIDGGMYAMRVLDSLCYYRIASCPLSASLTPKQEENVREILKLPCSEVLIMFIGIGNYPKIVQTTKSERHEPYTIVF